MRWHVYDSYAETSPDTGPDQIRDENDEVVAYVAVRFAGHSAEVAGLMAAAPELLDVALSVAEGLPCKAQNLRDPDPGCDCWACELRRAAKTAIAKAEGRP
jgi:hypothetical protein